MALITIHTFTASSGKQYTIQYNDVTHGIETTYTGSPPPDYLVTPAELGYIYQQVITYFCSGFTKYECYAILTFPFAGVRSFANSADCGYSCNVVVSVVTYSDESFDGAEDGTVEVSVSGAIGDIDYYINDVYLQTNNVFYTGLCAGTYILKACDSTGCCDEITVVIGTGITPSTDPEYPYQEKVCHWFLLYYFNSSGIRVDVDIEEPGNWDKVGITGKRDLGYHGWLYQFSDGDADLKFDCAAGKSTIDAIFNSRGCDGEIYFEFGYDHYNGNSYKIFEGKLNLNTYKSYPGYVQCTVQRKGFNDNIFSRIDTKISMAQNTSFNGSSVGAPGTYELPLLEKVIIQSYTLTNPDTESTFATTPYSSANFFIQPKTDNPTSNEIETSYFYPLGITIPEPYLNDKYVFFVQDEGLTNFVFSFSGKVTMSRNTGVMPACTVRFVLRVNTTDYYDSGDDITIAANGTGTTNSLVSGAFSTSLTLNKNDKVYFYIQVISTLSINGSCLYDSYSFSASITNESTEDSTDATVWFLDNAVQHCLNILSDGNTTLRSSLIKRLTSCTPTDGCFSLYTLTNGYQIRKFNTTSNPLKISLKDILDSLKALVGIGLGFEYVGTNEICRIEKDTYFFQDREITTITELFDYREEVAKEFIFNEIEVGYEKYKSEGLNIIDEYNTRHEYATPIKNHKNKLNLISKLISSGYAIEDSRRQQFLDTPTTSYQNDESGFIIAVRRSGSDYICEANQPFISVTEVIDADSCYNLRITPKRMLLNNGKWIKSGFYYKSNTDTLKNTFFDKNGDLTTDFLASETCGLGDTALTAIQEKADVTLTQLANSTIFRPEWVYFKTRANFNTINTINKSMIGGYGTTKDYGYIRIRKPDGTYQNVWIYELKYNFATEEAEFKTLKKS